MAKNEKEVETTEAVVDAAPVTAEAHAAPAKDGRIKVLVLEDGTEVNRKDYVLKRWGEKASRRIICDEVNAMLTKQGIKNIPYQIIFGYTKGIPGGPDPVVKAEAPAAAPVADTPAA